MTDHRPSIAELQREEQAGHPNAAPTPIRLALPVLLEIAAAALAWQKAVRDRCDYGTSTYASNPFDIMTEDFRVASEGLDAAADGLLREFLSALAKVTP